MSQPEKTAAHWVTPAVLDPFVRALVCEVDYDIHKNYECGEEDGLDHYPELVAEAAEMLTAITAAQPGPEIPAEVAAHVLWAEGHGGHPGSSFVNRLLNLWAIADDANGARLAASWPEYGAAIRLMQQPDGIAELKAIAGRLS